MKAVLYDFDGLLIDSETAGLLSWQRLYREYGHELDLDHWLAEIAAGRGPCMPTARLDSLVTHPIDWAATESRRLAWRDELLVARPGVFDHLAQAAELGLAKAIVSNAPDWWLTEQLDRTGIGAANFEVVITKSPGLAKKPAPDAYLRALAALGVAATDAVAFEDSPIGVAAAQAAGIACVAVPNLVTAHFDLSAADLVLPTLTARPLAELWSDQLVHTDIERP